MVDPSRIMVYKPHFRIQSCVRQIKMKNEIWL